MGPRVRGDDSSLFSHGSRRRGACHRAALCADPLAPPHHDGVDCGAIKGTVILRSALLRASRRMRHTPPHSRDRLLPELFKIVCASSNRGRREDRVRAAPAVSCALMHKEMRTRAYRFSGNTPAFPAQWLYDLYVLSLVNRSFLPPSPSRGAGPSRT
jgi:hypothetical protein